MFYSNRYFKAKEFQNTLWTSWKIPSSKQTKQRGPTHISVTRACNTQLWQKTLRSGIFAAAAPPTTSCKCSTTSRPGGFHLDANGGGKKPRLAGQPIPMLNLQCTWSALLQLPTVISFPCAPKNKTPHLDLPPKPHNLSLGNWGQRWAPPGAFSACRRHGSHPLLAHHAIQYSSRRQRLSFLQYPSCTVRALNWS